MLLCLLTEGVPIPGLDRGVPHPILDGERVPHPVLEGGMPFSPGWGGIPHPFLTWGIPSSPNGDNPSSTNGVVPHIWTWDEYPTPDLGTGYPPSGPGTGYSPSRYGNGVPPS